MRADRTLLLASVFLAACATEPDPETIRATAMDEPPEALVGTWKVTGAVGPQGRFLEPQGAEFTIEISVDGDAAGAAACNNWNGSVEHVDEHHLSLGAIGFTRDECYLGHADTQAFEQRFLTNLTRTMEWSRSSDTLTLQFLDGQEWELARPE